MTRIDELDFAHPAALYRSDRNGVALIRRQAAVNAGPTWARVVEAGAGLETGYLYLEYHSGDVQVSTVDGQADAALPQQAYLDPRLTSVGAYFEQADAAHARREAAELRARDQAAEATIRANTFIVQTTLEGHTWEVSVSPTVHGETTLVLSRAGTIRHLVTSAPRGALARAQTEPVEIEATERVDRRWFDPRTGRTRRTVTLTLAPVGGAPGASA